MVKKIFSLMSIFFIAALVLSGCGTFTAPAEARPPLRVEYTVWEGDYTLLIAQEKGFFAKNGVKVEPVFYETFSQAIPDMGGNKIDVGLFAIGDLLSASSVTKVRGVAVYDSGGTSTIVSRADILDIASLKGKKIGVNIGSYSELFTRSMLESVNMTAKDVNFVEVSPEEVADKLTSKEIDAGYVWAPYDQKAVEAGHKILYSRSANSSLFPDLIVFREDVLKERPQDAKAFLSAWFEALAYRLAHPDECSQIIARLTNQKVEDVGLSGNLQLYNQADNLSLFNYPMGLKDSSIYKAAQVNLDFLVSNGSLTFAPDLNQTLDSSFLK